MFSVTRLFSNSINIYTTTNISNSKASYFIYFLSFSILVLT